MMKQEGDGIMKNIRRVDRPINSSAKVSDSQDLLARILLPLPARTLITFKLVSNHFHSVISDPLFGIKHVHFHHKNKKSSSPTGLYFYSSFSNNNQIYSVSIFNPPRSIPSLLSLEYVGSVLHRKFKILQSCKGLLLCSFDHENSGDSCSPPSRLYCVCNPTTHDFIILPELPSVESSSKSKKEETCHPILTLAFNPIETHIYKVFAVRVVEQLARKCGCELLVYSSGEGERVWRKVGCQFIIPAVLKRIRHGVFHDGGKITWITERGFIHFDIQAQKVITDSSTWERIRFFGECVDGSLYMVERRLHSHVNVNKLNLETMKWEPRCRLDPRKFIEENLESRPAGYSSNMYQILAIENGGKHQILAIPDRVFCFCQVSGSSRVLRKMPHHQQCAEGFNSGCVTSFQFVETLCPL